MSIIGIDLGTTTSEVAYYKNGEARIIKNVQEGDSTIIPSVVLIEGDTVKVGIKAKNQMIIKPKNTVIEVKRLIGSKKKIKIDEKDYSATEISAMILKKIKNIAEFYIGEKVEEAVITVPANFNDYQRKETKNAAKLAGLKVERIINEPTAAAIAYGLDKLNKDMKILVYDFGGGTIDISILELFDGIIDVKTSRGNNNLGGADIDKLIINYILKDFYNKNKIKLDLNNPRIMSSLKTVSEECKKSLSFEEEYDIIIPYISIDKNNNPIDLNTTISRKLLEEMCQNILNKTEIIINEALNSASLKDSDIDKIILVGGTTRMPCIKNRLSNRFGEGKIAIGINPDEIVAQGAAIQAAIKSGNSSKNIIVTDAVSHSLGVEILGGKFDPIIKRDSKLPAEISKTYKTVEDGQRDVEIKIYQGENEYVDSNLFINSFELNNIPKAKKGQEIISITFKYDLNEILDVSAEIISTGENKKISLSTKPSKEEDLDMSPPIIENEIYHNEDENLEFDEIQAKYPDNEDDTNDVEYNIEDNIDDINDNVKDNSSDSSSSEEEEEEDYSNIFQEIVQLINYVNSILPSFPSDTQTEARDIMKDMITVVKEDKFKEVRELEMKLMVLLNIEG